MTARITTPITFNISPISGIHLLLCNLEPLAHLQLEMPHHTTTHYSCHSPLLTHLFHDLQTQHIKTMPTHVVKTKQTCGKHNCNHTINTTHQNNPRTSGKHNCDRTILKTCIHFATAMIDISRFRVHPTAIAVACASVCLLLLI